MMVYESELRQKEKRRVGRRVSQRPTGLVAYEGRLCLVAGVCLCRYWLVERICRRWLMLTKMETAE